MIDIPSAFASAAASTASSHGEPGGAVGSPSVISSITSFLILDDPDSRHTVKASAWFVKPPEYVRLPSTSSALSEEILMPDASIASSPNPTTVYDWSEGMDSSAFTISLANSTTSKKLAQHTLLSKPPL
eukprot:CAMPEP_0196182102 /NCGR_PEP_ID=MMETSP0911-20130528/28646_1 /TAXON_ID=49265 /ORGANISM="Thalassiosira rotula, Strain GSO102" /LENGTH=128 /DNA_ID=CAMNT_0041451727 /DNA_START=219 /DNA_END=602 /DNA_ORIENTATION=-